MQLEAVPNNLLLWNYTIRNEEGVCVELATAMIRERGSFTFDGTSYSIGREGLLAGPFVLRDEGGVVAAAQKSLMRRSFEVTTSAGALVLSADFVFTRGFSVVQQDRVVGHIRPVHTFTSRAHMEIDLAVSLPECVFLFWLVMITWRRAASGASS